MLDGEVQVSELRATWFCAEAVQSGSKNKDCVYNRQRGVLITNNSQQLQACCIPGVLGFDLKVKWQVFGLAEQVC